MWDLIMGALATRTYIQVLDLVSNIDGVSSSSGYDSAASLPVPDVSTLFSSPACSKAIFDFLNVDSGVSNYKVDPAFFERYPELYDHIFDIVASGTPLRPDVQHRLSCPKPLTPQTFQTYCNFLDLSYDASLYTNVVSY
jgi:threonine aldolase